MVSFKQKTQPRQLLVYLQLYIEQTLANMAAKRVSLK